MEYIDLSIDEQKQILVQRRKQYEGEYFNHSVNLELLQASGAADDATKEAIKASEDAMATLDAAHAATVAKIDAIEAGNS